jgi:hypothetical protein
MSAGIGRDARPDGTPEPGDIACAKSGEWIAREHEGCAAVGALR